MLIWNSVQSKKNSFVAFRKKFDGGAIKSNLLKIAVDGKYYLWLNGEQIVFEGGLNRGPAPSSHYFDEIDISPHIKKGENTLAVLVWYWGNGGRNNVFTERAGLWIYGALVSDESFKCAALGAYSEGEPPYPAYLYGGYNIAYNANMDSSDWQAADFDDGKWGKPIRVSMDEWGEPVKRPIPLLKNYGLKDFTRTDVAIDGGKKTITAYLPYAAWVSPYFEVIASRNDFFDIRTDRYEIHGGNGDERSFYKAQRCEYIAKEGAQSFEAVGAYFGEQVIFTMPETVEVLSLKYRETGYDCEFSGGFSCDDEELNTLYKKSRRTLYVCMRDNFMDCPDRERGQWIGDVSVQSPQVFYALSRSSDALLKKCISDFINWRNNDILRGNVPGMHAGELPSQSLNAISSVGMIHEYYMHTGDRAILDMVIEPVEKYLLLWKMDSEGLVEKRRGNFWAWFDHGVNIDEEILENCWYALALEFALSIRENGEFRNRLDSIKKNFNAKFWKPDGYRSADFLDDRANAMAVLAGFAEESKFDAIINVLKTVKNSTPYMENYVLESMFKIGRKEEAMLRMKERYGPLIKNENSTLWEDFDLLGTKNHAWSGGPLTHLCKWVAGIFPVKPGYEEFAIEPYLGRLSKVHAVIETVRGKIDVTIDRGNGVVLGSNIEKLENYPNRYRIKVQSE